jgi:uncharacterized repeat protein (TIGR03806 family)
MFSLVPRCGAGLLAPALNLILVLLLVGCSNGPGGDSDSPTPPPPGVDVTAPSVPAGVTAAAQAPTQVLLNWTASTDTGSGVAGYRVFRDGNNAPVATVATNSYTDNGVLANTSYTYTVLAFDGATPANESAQSALVSVTTPAVPAVDTTPPTVPTNVTAVALSSSQIVVSWAASTDAGFGVAGYRVYRDGSATPLATVTGTSFTSGGLSASTAYSYTVRAFDAATPANESTLSSPVSATTMAAPVLDTTPPTVPANVTAAAQSSSQILVSWNASTDAGTGVAGYRVYRDNSATPVATVTTTNFTDNGLTANTAYGYTVRAFDAATPANESALSASVSATTPPAPVVDTTPPTVPGNVSAAAQSATQILVTWNASTDAGFGVAGYRVYRNGSATPLATVTTTSFTNTGLTASTAYSYTVRAFDAATPANESALSAAASATTLAAPDTTAPTVPANVTAVAQSSTQILVSWNASTDAGTGVAGYRVFRDGSTTPLATVTTTSFTNGGLAAGTTHSYTVRAFDAATPANVSALSASVSATTTADTTPPTVPANVTAVAQSSSQILVSWSASTDASGISGYRVFRNGGATPVATVTTTNYTDTGLAAATLYSYTVVAVDGAAPANVSAPSAAASATTGGSTPESGLDSRPSNTTCLAGDAPSNNFSLAVSRVFPTLTFTQPIAMLQEPGNNARWYVVEKTGAVRVFDNSATPGTPALFINLASRLTSDPNDFQDERGLLGMAFHPNYPTDPRVYFFYTGTSPGLGLVDRVSQFRLRNDGSNTLDPASELEILNVDDPAENHNGGHLAFGPDGLLYIGVGDGGGGYDPFEPIGNGQNLNTLLGKMLRIDVSAATAGAPYTIPPSNPFAGGARCTNLTLPTGAICPEIYAYGLRNPWRWSFDRVSGELWLNDVGQQTREEVDRIVLGGNYGWRCREGSTSTGLSCGPNPNPIPPVAEYERNEGNSTTGGYVYRGSEIPGLVGRYVFADFGTGYLWNIARDTPPTLTMTTQAAVDTNLNVASFAEDLAGELYIVNLGGTLHRVVAATGGGGRQIPTLLSQTGCVNAGNPTQPAPGLIPYAPNAPFFSDNAVKTRWLALPNGQRITVDTDNDFDFPSGSVLMKNFTLNNTLIETRLFMRHNNGNWAGYTYEWNAGGSEATRVVGGKTVTVAGQTWQFPSEGQCLQCHTSAAGRTLGLEIGQLNGDFGYPSTGRTANQVVTLNAIDTLTPPVTQTPAQLPVIPNPFGSAALGSRARAWLHTNCANCHQPGGGTQSGMDLRYTTTLLGTNACDVAPTLGGLGITDPRLIAPGSAARSVVIARVNRTGTDAMPPLSRHLIDTAGVNLLTEWVNGLTSCN